jgi:hypothetical protein
MTAIRYFVTVGGTDETQDLLPEAHPTIAAANAAARAWLSAAAGSRPGRERVVTVNEDGRLDLAFDYLGRDGAYGDVVGGGYIYAAVERGEEA